MQLQWFGSLPLLQVEQGEMGGNDSENDERQEAYRWDELSHICRLSFNPLREYRETRKTSFIMSIVVVACLHGGRSDLVRNC